MSISRYTDHQGLGEKNKTFGQRRTEIIAGGLVHVAYLDERIVQVRSEGDRVPIIATDQAEPLNRRVEVRVDGERKRTATSLAYPIRNLVWG